MIEYTYKNTLFKFYVIDRVTLVMEVNNNSEFIKCFHKNGIAIQINKNSLSAENGAFGIYRFINRAIKNNVLTIYVDRIIDKFYFDTEG